MIHRFWRNTTPKRTSNTLTVFKIIFNTIYTKSVTISNKNGVLTTFLFTSLTLVFFLFSYTFFHFLSLSLLIQIIGEEQCIRRLFVDLQSVENKLSSVDDNKIITEYAMFTTQPIKYLNIIKYRLKCANPKLLISNK